MAEELHLTTARLVPELNTTAAALRLSASQPHVQTLKETKTTSQSLYEAYQRGITQSRPCTFANCVYLPISAGIHLYITVIRQ